MRRFGILYQKGATGGPRSPWLRMWRLPMSSIRIFRPSQIRELAFPQMTLVGLAGFRTTILTENSGGMQKKRGSWRRARWR